MEDSHAYRVCPKCLLREVLGHGADSLPLDSHASPPPTDSGPGLCVKPDFFKKYDLIERIGKGGQGDIWKAWDFEFRRYVAMKRLGKELMDSEPARHRFLAEAQIASQLDHPGILPVFDVGLDPDGRPYYTTQLLPGTTFGHLWDFVHDPGHPEWTIPRAVEHLVRVCEVMANAHSRGVIHRDLKPSNVLVGAFADVRVIDWGSAHVLPTADQGIRASFVPFNRQVVQTDRGEFLFADPGSPLATGQAGMPMTTLFMPPEILRGEDECLGPRTDVYSLGVMLYGLLTGCLPYARPKEPLAPAAELREMILRGPPVPVRILAPTVSRDLAAICAKAMAYAFADRYRTMTALMEDLRAALEVRPVQARHPGPWMILQKWTLRHAAHTLMASLSLIVILVIAITAHGFKVERDFARQTKEVRDAELAARNGHWREAIKHWDAAEADGYGDSIYLNLQRAEAWTILSEPDRSGALLQRLAARHDLGDQQGAVLLRLGEHELFDRHTAADGVKLVREALATGLNDADRLFAQGLLSDSTPEALELFHQALRYNPYHHGAHVQSLSLEWLLGHHQELANHVVIFKILYPDDPSPVYLAADERAMAGDLAGAEMELRALQSKVASNLWAYAEQSCRTFSLAAKFYDVETLLQENPPARTPLDKLRNDPSSAGVMVMPGDFNGLTNRPVNLRTPWLPCIQQGLLVASDGLNSLLHPYLGNPVAGVRKIESGWRHHPESFRPALGGMLLENLQPTSGLRSTTILQTQARLYQMGADSPSMMPVIGRLSRYLAIRTELELVGRQATNSDALLRDCLANLNAVLASPETSPIEFRAYFQFALDLGKPDLALQFVNRLENSQPDDPATQRSVIKAELALGTFDLALKKINQWLVRHPEDTWAVAAREAARVGLASLAEENTGSLKPKK